jgi:hypothetical protein
LRSFQSKRPTRAWPDGWAEVKKSRGDDHLRVFHHWRAARGLGAWTLAGGAVAPGFVFTTFALAPGDFTPGAGEQGGLYVRGINSAICSRPRGRVHGRDLAKIQQFSIIETANLRLSR